MQGEHIVKCNGFSPRVIFGCCWNFSFISGLVFGHQQQRIVALLNRFISPSLVKLAFMAVQGEEKLITFLFLYSKVGSSSSLLWDKETGIWLAENLGNMPVEQDWSGNRRYCAVKSVTEWGSTANIAPSSSGTLSFDMSFIRRLFGRKYMSTLPYDFPGGNLVKHYYLWYGPNSVIFFLFTLCQEYS